MPHQAADEICKIIDPNTKVGAGRLKLDGLQASLIERALREDAKGLVYSAYISILDAINGLNSAYFSWSIVKLYYTCFYCVRSILAFNNIAIFYIGSSPFSIRTSSGGTPRLENGTTHKVVWSVFERELPSHVLLNQIEFDKPFKWMMQLREEVNYRNPRFQDPMVPSQFSVLSKHGMLPMVNSYLEDSSLLYTFDPDHAVLAYPLQCLKHATSALYQAGHAFDPEEHFHLSTQSDNCQIPDLLRLCIGRVPKRLNDDDL